MKQKIAAILTAVMLVCLTIPQAFAVTKYHLTVTLSGPDGNNETRTISADTGDGATTTKLAAEVVGLLGEKYSEIETTFAGTGLRSIVDNGRTAFDNGSTAWENYVSGFTGDMNNADFKAQLASLDTTYGDLTVNASNALTYQGYTLTVTLKSTSTGSSSGGSSGSSVKQPTDEATTTTTVKNDDGSTTTIVKDNATGKMTVTVSGASSAKVALPASNLHPGLVAVDANGDVDPKSIVTNDGVVTVISGTETVTVEDRSKDFNDIPASYWAHDAVDYVSARGMMNGTSATTFSPNGSVTRGMIAAILYRLESEPGFKNASNFSDILNGQYYTDGVQWAAENGVVTGYSDGTYQPNQAITRQQFAAMLYRYLGQPAVDDQTTLNFSDAAQVSAYAQSAMKWAVSNGLLQGNNGQLNPNGLLTRAQCATILMRFNTYVMNNL